MNYSLGMTNELTNYIRQSSSRREALYLINSTDDLERYFRKMRADYEIEINELENRLDECLNYEQLVELQVDCHENRNKKEGLSLNLERYQDLLECNFKEIQWVRSSRMNQEGEHKEARIKKIDAIQTEVSKLQHFILQREAEQQKNLKDLQQSVEQQLQQIKQNFEQAYSQHKLSIDQQCTQILLLQQSLSKNLCELEQALKGWNTASRELIDAKLQSVESQLLQLSSPSKK